MASRYQAAQTRLRKFEEAGPPEERPREQDVTMRLRGGRTGKRAVVCEQLELTGLMQPFDLEVWYGERVAVLGSNGSGKSHFLRLLAARRHRPAELGHVTASATELAPVAHTGVAPARRPRACPAGSRRPTSIPSCAGRTLLDDPAPRRRAPRRHAARGREPARSTATSWRAPREQTFESLSGGQQARFQILLLELSGATLLLLDEPTDNLDLRLGRGARGGAGRASRAP